MPAKKLPWLVTVGRYHPKKKNITCTAILDGIPGRHDPLTAAVCGIAVQDPVGQDGCDAAALELGKLLMSKNNIFEANTWPVSDPIYSKTPHKIKLHPATPPEDTAKQLRDLLDAAEAVMGEVPEDAGMAEKIDMAQQAIRLYENTPAGQVTDADTILQDCLDNAEREITGTGPELIRIWWRSRDKTSVEKLFEAFTGHPFREYLASCIKNTTRPG